MSCVLEKFLTRRSTSLSCFLVIVAFSGGLSFLLSHLFLFLLPLCLFILLPILSERRHGAYDTSFRVPFPLTFALFAVRRYILRDC